MSQSTQQQELFPKNRMVGLNKISLIMYGVIPAIVSSLVIILMYAVSTNIVFAIFVIVAVFPIRNTLARKLKTKVRDVIGVEVPDSALFVNSALRYMGHKTEIIYEYVILVDGASLVYVDDLINAQNVSEAFNIARAKNIESVAFVTAGPDFIGCILPDAKILLDRSDAKTFSLNDVFNAVYEKTKSE